MQAITHPGRHLLLALVTGSALAAGVAQAQSNAPAVAPTAATVPAAPALTIRDIYDRMEAAGYRDMREIEFSKGRYQVEARNAQGERVKLYVNATSGVVEHMRRDD